MPTIRDIARQAQVSVSTASLALNDDPRVAATTRQRVLAAASALDYRPSRAARGLSKGLTYTLQILNASARSPLSSSFFARFVRGANEVASVCGYALALSLPPTGDGIGPLLDRILRERWCDGLLLLNPTTDGNALAALNGEEFPHVVVGRPAQGETWRVDSDNSAAARDAALHLLRAGRTPLAFLNAGPAQTFTHERRAGVALALREVGAAPEDVIWLESDGSVADAARTVRGLLERGVQPAGVLAVSDEMAAGALRTLHAAGLRVPADVAVVGMNDDDLAAMLTPPLSSVDLDPAELGRRATRLLLEVVRSDATAPRTEIVPHRLIVRESSS